VRFGQPHIKVDSISGGGAYELWHLTERHDHSAAKLLASMRPTGPTTGTASRRSGLERLDLGGRLQHRHVVQVRTGVSQAAQGAQTQLITVRSDNGDGLVAHQHLPISPKAGLARALAAPGSHAMQCNDHGFSHWRALRQPSINRSKTQAISAADHVQEAERGPAWVATTQRITNDSYNGWPSRSERI